MTGGETRAASVRAALVEVPDDADVLLVHDAARPMVSDAVIDAGGTITHHHAVGREHRPWYDRQRPEPFAEALRAAKTALDPAGILNPGVLIDPV